MFRISTDRSRLKEKYPSHVGVINLSSCTAWGVSQNPIWEGEHGWKVQLCIYALCFKLEMKDQAKAGIQTGCWKLSQNKEQDSGYV